MDSCIVVLAFLQNHDLLLNIPVETILEHQYVSGQHHKCFVLVLLDIGFLLVLLDIGFV